MQAKRLGCVKFDLDRLAPDLERIAEFEYDSRYEDYSLGGWKSCSLWNMNGDARDGTSYEYKGAAKITEFGAALSYVPELLARHFKMDVCKSARVFAIRSGSLMQHRDYMEFKAGFTRLHLVLQSTPFSFNSEEDTVYQMRQGEIWFVDGRPVHSAANFSEDWRYHLILDFDVAYEPEDLLNDVDQSGAPPVRLIDRPHLSDSWEALIRGVGPSIDSLLLRQMIPRLHFFYAVNSRDLFTWLARIAAASGDAAVIDEVAAMRRKFIGDVAAPS